MAKLIFFIKRLVGSWFALSDSKHKELVKKFPYITEVVEKTPSLYELISLQLKDVRLMSKIQHQEGWSIDGLKKADLRVSRNKIIQFCENLEV